MQLSYQLPHMRNLQLTPSIDMLLLGEIQHFSQVTVIST
jgi:hypothetical protein